jgi:hypothetical protein
VQAANIVAVVDGGVQGLTRPKISDRWRERVWLRVECGSHGKLERGAASGSLHRLIRPLRAIWSSVVHENLQIGCEASEGHQE